MSQRVRPITEAVCIEWLTSPKIATEEEKQLLLELLCTWAAPALAADAIAIPIAKPPQHAGR